MGFERTNKSRRLSFWDYGSDGVYFVSICTKDVKPYFGEIEKVKVASQYIATLHQNLLGLHAEKCILEIPNHFSFVEIIDFSVLPNIIYLILSFNRNEIKSNWTTGFFGPQSNNLGSVIRGFKIGVTKFANTLPTEFCWQRRYFDRVFRNSSEMKKIMDFIKTQSLHKSKKINSPLNINYAQLFETNI